jgi:type I restriction enzyme S subunit
MILSDYLNGVVDNRGRNPDRYFEKEKYPVIDNFLIKNELHPNILQASRYIDEQTYQNFLRGYIYPNMVIMTLVGNGIGNVTTISDPNSVIIQNTIGFDVKKDLLSDLFLFYFFYHKLDTIKQFDRGSGQPSIKKTDILNMEVDFPPLEIQKKIAGVLGALDDKIELNNKINNNLEQQAQALFKSWFIDFEPFGGVMPEDWKIGRLGEIAEIIMGQSPNGSSYNEEKSGCIFFQGRAEFGARFPRVRLYTTEPKRMAQTGDVIMSVRAPVGDFNVAMDNCCIGRGLCAIRSKQNCQSFILYTIWASQDRLNIFNGEGTVFGSVNKDSLYNMPVTIPTNEIMIKFENTYSVLDRLIWNNSLENTRLAALRDTLLPKLMKGEIDVSNVNISSLTSTDKLSFTED